MSCPNGKSRRKVDKDLRFPGRLLNFEPKGSNECHGSCCKLLKLRPTGKSRTPTVLKPALSLQILQTNKEVAVLSLFACVTAIPKLSAS